MRIVRRDAGSDRGAVACWLAAAMTRKSEANKHDKEGREADGRRREASVSHNNTRTEAQEWCWVRMCEEDVLQ